MSDKIKDPITTILTDISKQITLLSIITSNRKE